MTKEYKGFATVEQQQEEVKVRRVLIGTPALDGKVQLGMPTLFPIQLKYVLQMVLICNQSF